MTTGRLPDLSEFRVNKTKIALIVLFAGLGLYGVQLAAGYRIMKTYEACASDWRLAHPGKLAREDMQQLIRDSAGCVEGRLNAFERLFFDAEAARNRAEQLKAPPAAGATGGAVPR